MTTAFRLATISLKAALSEHRHARERTRTEKDRTAGQASCQTNVTTSCLKNARTSEGLLSATTSSLIFLFKKPHPPTQGLPQRHHLAALSRDDNSPRAMTSTFWILPNAS